MYHTNQLIKRWIYSLFELNMNNNKKAEINEELQSRREFFKKAAKGVLPILGAIALSQSPLLLKAAEKIPMGCDYYCTGECISSCLNACGDMCTGTCIVHCNGSCYDTCKGKCADVCTGGCGQLCGLLCTNSCTGNCYGSCYTNCAAYYSFFW